jgi:cell division protein ZapA (FtsZ GTPase activity inhibitor)
MIFEIELGKSTYKINCDSNQKEKLQKLAGNLNERLNKVSLHKKNADEKTLLAITALLLQEELEGEKFSNQSQPTKDEEIYNAISNNIENIAQYLENLTKKIENF